jgi:hypothetical protein
MSKFEDKRSYDQQRGQDGRCETVTTKAGVIVNAHEYNEKTHGPLAEGPKVTEVATAPPAGGNGDPKPVAWDKKTKEELKDALADAGVAFDVDAKKDDLIALCVKHIDKK